MTDTPDLEPTAVDDVRAIWKATFAELQRRIDMGDRPSVEIDLEGVDPQRAYDDWDEWELAALQRNFEEG